MKKNFKPLKTRFRATFAGNVAANRFGQIDKENEVLHDVQITLEGEAKGHGVHLDREFCEACAAQGNQTGDVGLKVRYGHPAMCSDAIGTELGRAKNFRVVDVERSLDDGTKVTVAGVVADVQLLKSAHSAPQGDIAAHVLAVAEEDPTQFGQSIVFTYADWVVKDADGNRHSYKEECFREDGSFKGYGAVDAWEKQSADGKIYAVLGKLHGSDFTDTPAATDGIFSSGTLAEEAETMLEEHPQILEVFEKSPKSVVEFLERTGLDKKLESARLSGLQAAKDKEIAALKAKLDEFETSLMAKDKEIAALKSADNPELNEFKVKLEESEKALAASKDEVSSLKASLAEKTAALSASQEQVANLEKAKALLTGGGIFTPSSEESEYKAKMAELEDHGTAEERVKLRELKAKGKIK